MSFWESKKFPFKLDYREMVEFTYIEYCIILISK
jgi:hypothetical protein